MDPEQPTWGQVDPARLASIVVVSPHFDDAALGAAQMLLRHAGSSVTAVITVFGGRPPAYPDPPTDWDALGGFRAGDDVVALRREEDRAAMHVLGATPVWLDFADHQYLRKADRPTSATVAPVLEEAILAQMPTAVFLPMGLANPDHVTTHDAGMSIFDRHPELTWFVYEDHGYKHLPGLLAWRVAKLMKIPTLADSRVIVPVDTATEGKRKAIWCYVSQIAPLERDHALTERLSANVPEQFWRMGPPPPGWERLADDL